jgi:hypothetical protein
MEFENGVDTPTTPRQRKWLDRSAMIPVICCPMLLFLLFDRGWNSDGYTCSGLFDIHCSCGLQHWPLQGRCGENIFYAPFPLAGYVSTYLVVLAFLISIPAAGLAFATRHVSKGKLVTLEEGTSVLLLASSSFLLVTFGIRPMAGGFPGYPSYAFGIACVIAFLNIAVAVSFLLDARALKQMGIRQYALREVVRNPIVAWWTSFLATLMQLLLVIVSVSLPWQAELFGSHNVNMIRMQNMYNRGSVVLFVVVTIIALVAQLATQLAAKHVARVRCRWKRARQVAFALACTAETCALAALISAGTDGDQTYFRVAWGFMWFFQAGAVGLVPVAVLFFSADPEYGMSPWEDPKVDARTYLLSSQPAFESLGAPAIRDGDL